MIPPSQPGNTITNPFDSYTIDQPRSGSISPERPPVSPITPVPTFARLATTNSHATFISPPAFTAPPATFIPQPPSIPILESDNPDAIALRAAISLLQIQREKSKRDLRTLETLKGRALAEPASFVEELKAGRLKGDEKEGDLLSPTLVDALKDVEANNRRDTLDSGAQEIHDSQEEDQQVSDSPASPASSAPPKFPQLPSPQNIVRCPPIEWAKYHVVGESLDKLHDEQVRRPTPGDVTRNQTPAGRPPVHVVASPYSPFNDKLADPHPMQTRRGSKKPS